METTKIFKKKNPGLGLGLFIHLPQLNPYDESSTFTKLRLNHLRSHYFKLCFFPLSTLF